MNPVRLVAIGWLCASLALMSALPAVLPALERQHELEHAQLGDRIAAQGEAHDGDDHSHEHAVIDLLSHLDTLIDVAGAIAGAMTITGSSAGSVLPAPIDEPQWLAVASPAGAVDPPERPPRQRA